MTGISRFRFVLLMIVFTCLLSLAAVPILAQEATPEPGFGVIDSENDVGAPVAELPTFELSETPPEPDTLPVADPAVAFDMLIKLISSITVGFASAPFTVMLVSLLKRWPALKEISAPSITFAVGVVLWIGSAIAGALGYQVQFNSLLEAATTILPALAGLFAVLIGAPALHQLSARADVPVLGYSRTPPAKSPPGAALGENATGAVSASSHPLRQPYT